MNLRNLKKVKESMNRKVFKRIENISKKFQRCNGIQRVRNNFKNLTNLKVLEEF